jgi:hypothetical protein
MRGFCKQAMSSICATKVIPRKIIKQNMEIEKMQLTLQAVSNKNTANDLMAVCKEISTHFTEVNYIVLNECYNIVKYFMFKGERVDKVKKHLKQYDNKRLRIIKMWNTFVNQEEFGFDFISYACWLLANN